MSVYESVSVIISGLLSYWVYYHIMSVNWGIKSASHKFDLAINIDENINAIFAGAGTSGKYERNLTWSPVKKTHMDRNM